MCFVVTTELIIARGNPLYTQIHFMLRSLLSIRLLSRNFQIDLFSLAMQIFVVVYDFSFTTNTLIVQSCQNEVFL